jgi:hypothetical protein
VKTLFAPTNGSNGRPARDTGADIDRRIEAPKVHAEAPASGLKRTGPLASPRDCHLCEKPMYYQKGWTLFLSAVSRSFPNEYPTTLVAARAIKDPL